mmetsp:Transcript_31757/g.69417  ORF Transcript_31757/g.69417 Transcript_31757/m.69417 type:complete len:129 (-) Transcript_31757:400-786(-)
MVRTTKGFGSNKDRNRRYKLKQRERDENREKDNDSDPQRAAPSPPQRTSARRQSRVDLSRLETASLRKYRRVYKLSDVGNGAKEDLVSAVARHFQSQVMEQEQEEETLLAFAMTLRQQAVSRQNGGMV